MNNATSSNPLEKLAHLSQQRTARTDRLYEATQALLARIDRCGVEVGDEVTVDGLTLAVRRLRSNVGTWDHWALESDGEGWSVILETALDADAYLHGDFHASYRGPSREHLLEFGKRAERFVAALIESREATVAALDKAAATVAAATATMGA